MGQGWQRRLTVLEVTDAVKAADVVMMLLPDEQIADVYRNDVEPHIRKGATLAFAHGFNMHYNQVMAREDLDVVMIAPKAPGHTVRNTYASGGGVPLLMAVHQDASRRATSRWPTRRPSAARGRHHRNQLQGRNRDRPVRRAGGALRRAVELIKAGYETLVEAGYAPEMAYFECLHELKLIVDLIYEGGIANMNYSISNNAEYGEYVTGPKIITAQTKRMRNALKHIQTGEYARVSSSGRPYRLPRMRAAG